MQNKLEECCILFCHYKNNDITKYHLKRIRYYSDYPVIPICFDTHKGVPGSIKIPIIWKEYINTGSKEWRCMDALIYQYYIQSNIKYKRYIIMDWDCYVNGNIRKIYDEVWNSQAGCSENPNHKEWAWRQAEYHLVPEKLKNDICGFLPISGSFLSQQVLETITNNDFNYPRLFCELRLGTLIKHHGFNITKFKRPLKATLKCSHEAIPKDFRDINIESVFHPIINHTVIKYA